MYVCMYVCMYNEVKGKGKAQAMGRAKATGKAKPEASHHNVYIVNIVTIVSTHDTYVFRLNEAAITIRLWESMYLHAYIHTHIHTCIHTYIHAHIHSHTTHTQMCVYKYLS